MDVEARKQELRERIWERLEREGAARFPGTRRRIPNFAGAEAAARRLGHLEQWNAAAHLKCNPDSPQLPVRKAALVAGKTVFMAVPRLRDPKLFLALDPAALEASPHRAASIKGASRYGRPTAIEEMPIIDLVIAGSVAVSADGARLGKGGGYSDLEFALARAAGRITDATVVITTVHPLQVVDDGAIPMTAHDVPLDYIVTPEGIIPTRREHPRPPGILWEELEPDKIESIPVLNDLRRMSGADQ